MKKRIYVAIFFVILQIIPFYAIGDEIESIRSDVQSGSYDMEKINHAPIYIPDVSEINVIRAEKYEANPEIIQKYENNGMMAIDKMKRYTVLYMGDEYDQKYGFDKRTQFSEYHIDSAWKLDDGELYNIYAKNQTISAGTVVDKANSMVQELYDESIGIEIKRIEVVSGYQIGKMVSNEMISMGDYEFGDLTGIGGYTIEAYPTLDGVPIIASANSGYIKTGTGKNKELFDALYFSRPMISAFYYSNDYMNIILSNVFKKKELVIENVELCGFDKIYDSIENYVNEGKIKRIYSINLGYVIYLEQNEEYSSKKEKNGEKRDYSEYILIPTWVVMCSYSEDNSNDGKSDISSFDDYEREDLNYQKIFIDARTGKLHDPKEVGSERYYADLH